MGNAVLPAHSISRPTAGADIIGIDLRKPELAPFSLDAYLAPLRLAHLGRLELRKGCLAFPRLLSEGPECLPVLLAITELASCEVALVADELGDLDDLVGRQDAVAKGLGGIAASEVARLGCGKENLLHGAAVYVDITGGLVGLGPVCDVLVLALLEGSVDLSPWEHAENSAGIWSREWLALDWWKQ